MGTLMRGPGHVYGFEPGPANIERLLNNLSSNEMVNFTLIGKAVSDRTGPSKSSVADGVRASLVLGQLENQIDVEGAEKYVPHGARQVLDQQSAPMLIIEIHDEKNKVIVSEILVRAGHSINLIEAQGVQVKRYPYHILAKKHGQ